MHLTATQLEQLEAGCIVIVALTRPVTHPLALRRLVDMLQEDVGYPLNFSVHPSRGLKLAIWRPYRSLKAS